MKIFVKTAAVLIIYLTFSSIVLAAKIGDLTHVTIQDQAIRFLQLKDPTVRIALMGSILLGVSCGLLGVFTVVRKESLLGDTLSHAVLPGICIGFLLTLSKSPWALFIGATLAGIIGIAALRGIIRLTNLKIDTAMGLILTGFYGIGICLLTTIQKLPIGTQAGLDKFLFGQAAALSLEDLYFMGTICTALLISIKLFYKELLLISFDNTFAACVTIPRKFLNAFLLFLLALTIVVSIKAVGIVLVSAILIMPTATAMLLTNKFSKVILLSVILAVAAATLGSFLSFLAHNLPTGPFIVVSAFFFFGLAFVFSPKQGLLKRWWLERRRAIH